MRGAIDYPLLLVLVVLVASGMLIVQIGNKFQFERQLGDTQTSVLRANGDVALFDAYLKEASRQVLNATFTDANRHPELFFLSIDPDQNCAILNDAKTDPKVVFTPNIEGRLSEKLTEGLKPYVQSYNAVIPVTGQSEFEVGLSPGLVTVVALSSFTFDLLDSGGVRIGQASHRPAFTVQFDHKLDGYVEAVRKLGEVAAKCSYDPAPEDCVKRPDMVPDWEPMLLADDRVLFFVPNRHKDMPCFELFLPPQSKQPVSP